MNIDQILSEGSGLVLNSVKVLKNYGKSGSGGSQNLALLIEDNSGKTMLKLWGAAANNEIPEETYITVEGQGQKGGLKVNEYQGRKSINANDCTVVFGGGSQPAQQAQTAEPAYGGGSTSATPQNQSSSPQQLNWTACAQTQARYFNDVLHELQSQPVAQGVPIDVLAQCAATMTGGIPEWWFGKKQPGCSD